MTDATAATARSSAAAAGADRTCLSCGASLAGYRVDAEMCGPGCKGQARRASEAFWRRLKGCTTRYPKPAARPARAVRVRRQARS